MEYVKIKIFSWERDSLVYDQLKMDTELDYCLFYFERIGMNDLF